MFIKTEHLHLTCVFPTILMAKILDFQIRGPRPTQTFPLSRSIKLGQSFCRRHQSLAYWKLIKET